MNFKIIGSLFVFLCFGLSATLLAQNGAGISSWAHEKPEVAETPRQEPVKVAVQKAPAVQEVVETVEEPQAVPQTVPVIQAMSCGGEKICSRSKYPELCLQKYGVCTCPCNKATFRTLHDHTLFFSGVGFDASKNYFLDASKGTLEEVKERVRSVREILKKMGGKTGPSVIEEYNRKLEEVGYPIDGSKDNRLIFIRHRTNGPTCSPIRSILLAHNKKINSDSAGFYLDYYNKLVDWQGMLEQNNNLGKYSFLRPAPNVFKNSNCKPMSGYICVDGKLVKPPKTPIHVGREYTESILDSYESCGLPVKLMYDYFNNVSFLELKGGEKFPSGSNGKMSLRILSNTRVNFSR